MGAASDTSQLINLLQSHPEIGPNLAHVHRIPPKEAETTPFPEDLPEPIISTLQSRGIDQLYSHQADCWNTVQAGKHTVVVTPTASGKTLCYNMPVLTAALNSPGSKALYLFPTKALSQDQVAELNAVVDGTGKPIKVYTFDGDTPHSARQAIRKQGNVVVTNPESLYLEIEDFEAALSYCAPSDGQLQEAIRVAQAASEFERGEHVRSAVAQAACVNDTARFTADHLVVLVDDVEDVFSNHATLG